MLYCSCLPYPITVCSLAMFQRAVKDFIVSVGLYIMIKIIEWASEQVRDFHCNWKHCNGLWLTKEICTLNCRAMALLPEATGVLWVQRTTTWPWIMFSGGSTKFYCALASVKLRHQIWYLEIVLKFDLALLFFSLLHTNHNFKRLGLGSTTQSTSLLRESLPKPSPTLAIYTALSSSCFQTRMS